MKLPAQASSKIQLPKSGGYEVWVGGGCRLSAVDIPVMTAVGDWLDFLSPEARVSPPANDTTRAATGLCCHMPVTGRPLKSAQARTIRK